VGLFFNDLQDIRPAWLGDDDTCVFHTGFSGLGLGRSAGRACGTLTLFLRKEVGFQFNGTCYDTDERGRCQS
jgi:hypothetical protein